MIEIKQAIVIDLKDYTILSECKKRYNKVVPTYRKNRFGNCVYTMRKLGLTTTTKEKEIWDFDFGLSEEEAKVLDNFIYYFGGECKNNKNLDYDWLYDIGKFIDAIVDKDTNRFEIIIKV